jgi:hypothetical protein
MRSNRNQTRIRHYLIAIAWFAAALAIYSSERVHERRLAAEAEQALASLKAADKANPASDGQERIRQEFLPGSICCCDWGAGQRQLRFDAVPHKLLFVIAGILMWWGHRARIASLILGTWAVGLWLLQNWLLVSPRGDWLH